ncbi:YlaI family protein [Bacillus aquiflavi]|uniref:YlaI family protein n=1 Tax=Bacillus aquiflavi TaxID=2672567 RepID=A0A6B3VV80_9BACI|nr:YlaI family protein [Bacillus aquiflavi]MBA4537924.1 YlaI family protein [Bacillus aquiflavi]NEY82180.1 YlaI family protein [Bacillus aquiflavi]UAC49257.1 YlaI family protein [Bacillus aquiflavi]
MKVKCVICDKIDILEDNSFLAKRLRNRPLHTYMCETCNNRITKNTEARIETGNFRLYEAKKQEDEW